MAKLLTRMIGGLIVALVALVLIFMVGMRAKYPPVLNAVRRTNRAVGNPRVLQTAGQPGATAAVIRHVGRSSGASYETPIGPYPTDDGFVVALPYGTSVDWLKNVQAADSAEIVHEGVTYRVDHPEIISAEEALLHIPADEHRTLRIFAVDEFLAVRRVEAVEKVAEPE